MPIHLYEHNEKAYGLVMAMLSETGKAAVVHPTGTGKSFIGFKLCEDHPDEKICWLSPSRHIYDTQLENLAAAGGRGCTKNIEFITYARLMNMTDEEMGRINPAYIILDEFHRCGASAWGQGVSRLLGMYEGIPLLGLSATAIRYLDNQRDMSDELFDGHVASRMTLGEAIVKGILNPPVYVQAVYSYMEDLSRYESRVQGIRNRKRREKAEALLEQLKHALDKAEGLDELFSRHMADRHGRYIIFCADYEAMLEAMGKTGEWFHKVDGNPAVYHLYADEPESMESFRQFKEDKDRSRLRLLYCIDALNEGVHVEDVSGVILLRPTVSPVIYKQQIGRALSAGSRERPVIFDIVNNIENLYSIDAIKEEMDAAINYMRDGSSDNGIVNEAFEVTGELKDCIRLFDSLEDALAADWDAMYKEAVKYYKEHGDLLPAQSYETGSGYALGRWVSTQRANRRNGNPILTAERIGMLDRIGMSWDSAGDRLWNTFYQEAVKYYGENGNLDIPAGYETDGGIKLGRMYRSIREKYKEGKLPEEKKAMLEEIGIKSGPVLERRWMGYYGLAKEYFEEHGDLNIPHDYVAGGLKVGVWISTQRENYGAERLTEEQIRLLEGIGMSWDRFESRWERGFEYCRRYEREHGDINKVPADLQYDGFKPALWLRTQRYRKRIGKLSEERIRKLEAIGIEWDKNRAFWEKGYSHAKEYAKEHGSMKMPAGYICEDGFKLKSWLNNQRTKLKEGKLSEEQAEKLAAIGFTGSL